jgi:hypothetical protein
VGFETLTQYGIDSSSSLLACKKGGKEGEGERERERERGEKLVATAEKKKKKNGIGSCRLRRGSNIDPGSTVLFSVSSHFAFRLCLVARRFKYKVNVKNKGTNKKRIEYTL